jgi:hypothetical protein
MAAGLLCESKNYADDSVNITFNLLFRSNDRQPYYSSLPESNDILCFIGHGDTPLANDAAAGLLFLEVTGLRA